MGAAAGLVAASSGPIAALSYLLSYDVHYGLTGSELGSLGDAIPVSVQ